MNWDQWLVFLFSTLFFLIALFLFIHLKPAPRHDPRAHRYVIEALNDESFQDVCSIYCELSDAHRSELAQIVRSNMVVQFYNLLRGGYATRMSSGEYFIALPSFPVLLPERIVSCAAIHELLHHVRNVQGDVTFAKEDSYGRVSGLYYRNVEEVHVWQKTVRADFLGSFLTGFFYAFVFLSLPFLVRALVLSLMK